MDLLDRHVPAPLLALGPNGLRLWQWAATPLLLVVALVVGLALGRVSRFLLVRIARRTPALWDDELAQQTGAPFALAWAATFAWALSPWLLLPPSADHLLERSLRAVLFFAFFWLLYRVVRVLADLLLASPWARTRASARALVPLGARIVRLAVVAIGLVAMLADFGYPVASLLTGLGIGGLAVALAAKTTLENLFGAFALGTDEPFAVGDLIRSDGVEGVVEGIGLRSTRIRTADRTLISIPNGKLAEVRVESLAARDRFRLNCTLALALGTTAAQLHAVLTACEGVLRAQPALWPNDVVVSLSAIGSSSLDVEINAWFATDFATFRAARQEVLMSFVASIEKAGATLAVPTTAVRLLQPPS